MSHDCTLRRDSITHIPKDFPNASWREKLHNKIQELFVVSIDHPEVFKFLHSRASIEKESRRQVQHFPAYIIHPLSKFRKYWNIVIFFVLVFHQMMTPFAVGFFVEMEDDTIDFLILLDISMCLILLFEILLNFVTGYIVTETNEVILDPKAIGKKSLKYLANDLVTCVPYVFLTTVIVGEHEGGSINGATIIYMFALFIYGFYRFSRILFYFSAIPKMMKLSEKGTIVITLCLRSFFCWHWASCVRRLIPLYVEQNRVSIHKWEDDGKGLTKYQFLEGHLGEINQLEAVENLILEDLDEIFKNYTMLNRYTRTMMITLKLALQSGYGSETSDSIYNMLATTFLIFGGWVFATYVLILISNVIMASTYSENKFEEMSREIDAFCEAKRLSKRLTVKIKTFFTYKYRENYFNEEAINESTPVNLQKEIMMHKCAAIVQKVALFREIPTILLENLISCLKLEVYFPDDVIIKAGAMGDSMYFLAYGTAAIYHTSGMRIGTMTDGSHFGEICLLIKGQKRTASIVALEVCEVYKLNQKDFRKVVEPHADVLRRLDEIAVERLRIIKNQEKLAS